MFYEIKQLVAKNKSMTVLCVYSDTNELKPVFKTNSNTKHEENEWQHTIGRDEDNIKYQTQTWKDKHKTRVSVQHQSYDQALKRPH